MKVFEGVQHFEMLDSVSEGFALFLYFCKHKAYFKGSCRNKGLFAKEIGCILTDLYYNKLDSPFFFFGSSDCRFSGARLHPVCVHYENQA
jgi:hypothetical protein